MVHLELPDNQEKGQASCIHYRREWKVWGENFLLWLDFFLVEISRIPTKTPHEKYYVILWNQKCNYYKEVSIFLSEKMKRKWEATSSASMSKHLCKDIIKVIMLEELNKINFNTCKHMLQTSEIIMRKINGCNMSTWGVLRLKDWLAIHQLIIKEMICNFKYAI